MSTDHVTTSLYVMTPPSALLPASADHHYAFAGVLAQRFGPGDESLDDACRVYLTESVPANGVKLRHDVLRDGRGNSYSTMASGVLAGALDGRPLDLMVLAHAVPDFNLNKIAAVDASIAAGGVSATFGVTDRGSLTPFTALRLATMFAARQRYGRIAVVVADQATLPYDTGSSLDELHGDAAVALIFERSTGPGIRTAQRSVPQGAVDDTWLTALDDVVRQVCEDSSPERVVVGAGVPEGWIGPFSGTVGMVHAPAGLLCAGPWSEVLGDGKVTVVVEADATLGAVGAALLTPVVKPE